MRVVRVVTIACELFRARIEPVQSTAQGANPEETRLIFEECGDGVSRQRGGIFRIVAVDGEAVAIVLVESLLRPQPQESQPILKHSLHDGLRGAGIGERNLHEADIPLLSPGRPGQAYTEHDRQTGYLQQTSHRITPDSGQGARALYLNVQFNRQNARAGWLSPFTRPQ